MGQWCRDSAHLHAAKGKLARKQQTGRSLKGAICPSHAFFPSLPPPPSIHSLGRGDFPMPPELRSWSWSWSPPRSAMTLVTLCVWPAPCSLANVVLSKAAVKCSSSSTPSCDRQHNEQMHLNVRNNSLSTPTRTQRLFFAARGPAAASIQDIVQSHSPAGPHTLV